MPRTSWGLPLLPGSRLQALPAITRITRPPRICSTGSKAACLRPGRPASRLACPARRFWKGRPWDVLSSQVDLQGSQAKQGYVSLSANCEVGQGALQRLLYDLESGMPFLFIDQLVVQMPQSGGAGVETEAARMRVQIDVSGQWQVTK